jgi:hypothetical protein
MSEYRFLCPECGHAFLEGTSFTHCPKCQVPLLEAPHSQFAEVGNLPNHLDLDGLMREAMAQQDQHEEIDSAVQRFVESKYPDSQERLCQLIRLQLDTIQSVHGITRQEAAKQLAESQSELVKGPEKRLEIRTVATKTKWLGFDGIPAEQREQLKAQIAKAIDDGNPNQKFEIVIPAARVKTSLSTILVALAILSLLAWRVWTALR